LSIADDRVEWHVRSELIESLEKLRVGRKAMDTGHELFLSPGETGQLRSNPLSGKSIKFIPTVPSLPAATALPRCGVGIKMILAIPVLGSKIMAFLATL
jgi:hypothetical protein